MSIFNDPSNFQDPNSPSVSNSYKFEDSVSMSSFAKQLSHNAGVKSVVDAGNRTLNVDFRGDRFMQDANTRYSDIINPVTESVELDEVRYKPGERIKKLNKEWNNSIKQIENSVKVMKKEYSKPEPDWGKIHKEMNNIEIYQLENIKDFIPQKGYKGPLEGSPVDIVD